MVENMKPVHGCSRQVLVSDRNLFMAPVAVPSSNVSVVPPQLPLSRCIKISASDLRSGNPFRRHEGSNKLWRHADFWRKPKSKSKSLEWVQSASFSIHPTWLLFVAYFCLLRPAASARRLGLFHAAGKIERGCANGVTDGNRVGPSVHPCQALMESLEPLLEGDLQEAWQPWTVGAFWLILCCHLMSFLIRCSLCGRSDLL